MKRYDNLAALSGKLAQFLRDAGWRLAKGSRGLTFYAAPETLGIRGEYFIALPEDVRRTGAERVVHNAAEALRALYGIDDIGALLDQATALSVDDVQPTTIISRFVDSKTSSGTMPLASLKEYLDQLGRSLYAGAKFKLGGDTPVTQLLAKRFADDSRFLQTAEGSFIAKVEVPGWVLRQADLFGGEEVRAAAVTAAIFSAIEFLNARVIDPTEPSIDEDVLRDSISLFDVELLETLAKLLIGPGMEQIDFTLEAGMTRRMTGTGRLTDERISRLKEFVAFVREHMRGEDDIDVTGAIVELRSRNPEGDRNYIRVVANYFGDRVALGATLTNEQYQVAVDAHKQNRPVRIRGHGVRLKTQIRIQRTEVLEVASVGR